ncbi:F-box/LRR-repeat protein 13-like isoform X2 [Cornus florida]|uniref:F-box/LRR-repeat protein 13-like isoform X2 n=1 Tax=Cornus florida TaxID=4283 RepID=UPI00289FFE12|nr:F-box/LRR-repeat protein 13-like isoform X2 [Cornus florida]XP_059657277.1 F-box/LRR-repeat protein 13-like isoform X2 [Cornus florida]XP_059657278.1 F-box/LRR-repeat protein 13-like isoform X2 [Cornus florida]XP_059657279.1 F-box/LRR-repeat protein 13-like isoform X2 [Cornus florida]XP_059657280.1 F-box/LRR-repeat protein 13-like isoform X2 [Cornus florida]
MEKTSEKVDKGGLCLEDHISGLPDVVIVSILSLLTMKEAGRTSLLSKRWRYMWTHITGLNFDALHVIYEVLLGNKELEVERPLYLSWVNQVLKLYNGPSIDQFRVQFDLDESCRFDIDNWVNFAIEKRVKRLELDFPVSWGSTGYNFPDTGRITNHLHSLSLGFTICNSLTNLLLAHVNVTGQVLEYFLTNCPFLEQLSVEASDCLVNLKVPNVSIKLKCLEIIYCHYVESIEISAMNLVSFKYFGPKIGLPFKNLQEPVEMYIGGEYCKYLIYNFLGISSYLSQLESLTLHMNSIKNSIGLAKFPVFNKLKQLELRISAIENEDLMVFAPLIEACPFLYKFVLELQLSKFVRRKRRRFTSRPHQYLKVVEFIGFAGLAIDVELAMYLIKSAVMLEKITFDPRNPLLIGSPWEFMETKEKKTARKRAKYLGTKLPAGVALG